ncbi:MAG TPA: efflux RND transporter permease subunit, partial [Vicinamibacterales bacterium]|nr:efflux RND transporter permease subunit [Vicinamibacterales bacterium]
QDNRTASWSDGQRSVALAVDRQPGTNTVAVVDAIRALLPTLRTEMPAGVQLRILHDHSTSIRESVGDVTHTLLLTIFLVILVIFLFLRNVSATIIPSLALPFSLVGTFAVMYELGYSLDNLSLLALTLAVGFVVDDAIVMLENIVRHLEMGKSVLEAALDGSREIAFTILSMTLSLTAVFIPVLFMGGILGRLLHEFAVTIAAAILVSGFVSLTLTPMLASRFLRPAGETRHGRLYRASERAFDGLLHAYEWSLQGALRHGRIVLLGTAAIIVATGWLFTIVPTGFVPSEDEGLIMGSTQGPEGTSFQAMEARQQEAAGIIRRDPNVAHFMSNVNDNGSGFLFMQLKPRDKRRLTADQVIGELRPKLAQIPGLRVFLRNPPPINIGGHVSKSQYQFTLQSPDTTLLYNEAPRFLQRLEALPQIEDATSDLQMRKPQVDVDVNRNEAAALGVTAQQVETALFTAYGSRQVSMIYAPNDEYEVILQLEPRFQRSPSALQDLYIRSSSGSLVPLASVARLKTTTGPLSINHVGQLPAVTMSFNLAPGVSLGSALAAVEQAASHDLPSSITTSFQGTAQAFQSSLTGLGILLVLAVLVIYIVLGILYESFIHPLTILSGLPAAGFGALLTLLLFHVDLDLYSFVGVIMLVGLVKKNGIMMIDFALDAQRREHKPAMAAIYEGAVVRFRPIMMTTAAALMATLPIALGTGAGSESRRPLGLAVVGGLLFSQFLTLYITPVVYVYMDRVQTFFGVGARTRAPRTAPAGEPASPRPASASARVRFGESWRSLTAGDSDEGRA